MSINPIKSWKDLKVGQKVWLVYGTMEPFMKGDLTISSESKPFREHSTYPYDEFHKFQADSIAFEVTDGDGHKRVHFATDGNLIPGCSLNRNYWFASEKDAQEALTFFQESSH